MEEPRDKNPVTKVWKKVGQNVLMLSRLLEFMKLAKITFTTILGSVEDERTFSTLGFMKSKLRNCLGEYLNTCVKLFSQPFFTHDSFSYSETISHWREQKTRLEAEL
jgi:hypothetical protein